MADDWELWGKKTGFEKTDSAVTKGITVNIQAVRDKVDNAIVAICDSILDVAENMKNKRSLVLAINEMDIVNQLSNLVDARSKLDDSTERQRLK